MATDSERATTAGGAQPGAELRLSAARDSSRAGGRLRDGPPGLPCCGLVRARRAPETSPGPAPSLHRRGSSGLYSAPLSPSLLLCPRLEGTGSVVTVAEGRSSRHASAAAPQMPGTCAAPCVTWQSRAALRSGTALADSAPRPRTPGRGPDQWLDSSDSKNGEEEKQEDSDDSGTREAGARASPSRGQSGGEAAGGAPSGAALSSPCRYLM